MVVLYDCESNVALVAQLPVTGFIPPQSVESLVDQLQYADQRLSAIEELERKGATAGAALPALRRLLGDPGQDERVRTAARIAIEKIAVDSPSPRPSPLPH
jgi:HEAT repeat protein